MYYSDEVVPKSVSNYYKYVESKLWTSNEKLFMLLFIIIVTGLQKN